MIDLLRESVLIQAVLAVSLAGAIIYQVVTGTEVSDVLLSAFNIILGFYFGSKLRYQQSRGR